MSLDKEVIFHNGKECEKEYVYITESLCCTPWNIVNQLYFNLKNKKEVIFQLRLVFAFVFQISLRFS